MFRFRSVAVSFLVVGSLMLTWSADSRAAEEVKIGYVDLQRALNEVTEGATAKAALKKEFDEKQKTLDNKQTELKGMKEELDARGMMMTPEAKQERMGQLQQKLMETQQLYVQLQQELSQREAAVTGEIFQKMGTILQAMGRAADYTVIVEKSAVLYAKNHIDLTNELIRKYNESYGKGATKK